MEETPQKDQKKELGDQINKKIDLAQGKYKKRQKKGGCGCGKKAK